MSPERRPSGGHSGYPTDESRRQDRLWDGVDSFDPRDVREVLEHLADISYLGRHTLSRHPAVQRRVRSDATHIERGKALRRFLMHGIAHLRPDGARPKEAGYQWLPFVVLERLHWMGEAREEILTRLAVSEGTFYRARRRGIETLSQVLEELAARPAEQESPVQIRGWQDVAECARRRFAGSRDKVLGVVSTDAAGWLLGVDEVQRGSLRIGLQTQRDLLRSVLLHGASDLYVVGYTPYGVDERKVWNEPELHRLQLGAQYVGLRLRDVVRIEPDAALAQSELAGWPWKFARGVTE